MTGWMVAHREQAGLAERLIAETIAKQGIAAGQLTSHADRGSSLISKPVVFLSPYSEAQFKTLKYRPGFPNRFASITEARASCRDFFRWYNTEHCHAGIDLLTGEMSITDRPRRLTLPGLGS